MNFRFAHRLPHVLGAVLGLAIAAGGSGCDKKLSDQFRPNLAPTVRLTHAPLTSTSREKYSYRMNWIGYDPDGRISHYLWKIDPADPDRPDETWFRTVRNDSIFDFDAGSPDEPINHNANSPSIAASPHVFAIVAVDNAGQLSEPVYRAFFATTVAPFVVVESPRPSQTAEALLTPSVRITMNGSDPDGPTGRPDRFVYRLFGRKNPDFPGIGDFTSFAWNPATRDSFRKLYAPTFGPSEHCPTCTPWQSTPADSGTVQYTNLIPLSQYLFVATGFDKAGAYDPIFSRAKNMLLFNVSFAGTRGPRITMWNEFFNYTYDSPGYSLDPSRYFRIEIPADRPVTFNWIAEPPAGAEMRRYRWVLDLEDLDDETPRENQSDWYHWSSWSLNNTSATVGPFSPPPGQSETHLFFIEAEDNIGLTSLGIIQFVVVRPTFDGGTAPDGSSLNAAVLIVQDCRLAGDKVVSGTYLPPEGAWPMKAELDSFFYAVGNKPWRGAYAAGGHLSRPGLFAGYKFDTMSTRAVLTGIVPLSRLSRYKYVIWYVDETSASRIAGPGDLQRGAVALRWMSSRNQPNTLATYIQQGGSVWAFGGGIAIASLSPWNRTGTDANVFTFRDNELIAGRFLYDYAHWRSRVDTRRLLQFATLNWNYPRFNSTSPSRGWPGAPDYSKLLARAPELRTRSASNPADSLPPLRNPDSWYSIQYSGEVLTDPNFIIEDIDGPGPGGEISTLDTLYITGGGQAEVNERPIMTYYHGNDFRAANLASEAPGLPQLESRAYFVFSGFPLWVFSPPQQQAIVDFVMQDIWGMTKTPVVPTSSLRASAASPAGRRLAPQTARPLRRPGVQR